MTGRPHHGSQPAYFRDLGLKRAELITTSKDQTSSQLLGDPKPLPSSDDIQYMAELKQELNSRFRESPFFLLPRSSTSNPIHRYLDKYRESQQEVWTPVWERLPKELRWGSGRKRKRAVTQPKIKKPRLDLDADERALKELEEKESAGEGREEEKAEEGAEEEGEEAKGDEEQELSDDDYLEEDNDYIESYFDNGENYAEESDDNLDEDATY